MGLKCLYLLLYPPNIFELPISVGLVSIFFSLLCFAVVSGEWCFSLGIRILRIELYRAIYRELASMINLDIIIIIIIITSLITSASRVR